MKVSMMPSSCCLGFGGMRSICLMRRSSRVLTLASLRVGRTPSSSSVVTLSASARAMRRHSSLRSATLWS
jgi:hypothetical protein